jgi:phage shock protein A
MLNQILRDMETEITKARSQVADMMAQERLFSDDLLAERDKVRHMDERAEYYVRESNDTMAREALRRKADSEANIEVLQKQLSAQSDMVSRLRGQLDALEAKYKDSLANRDNMLARYHRAKTQQQMTRTMSNLDVTDYSGALSRMENRIRMTEARSDAETQLNNDMSSDTSATFDNAERNAQIDQELAALKSRIGGGGETKNLKRG